MYTLKSHGKDNKLEKISMQSDYVDKEYHAF